MLERVFGPGEQAAFAELSGDFNPMHVDPQAARRLMFGRPVVHGVHAVLAGLEAWLAGEPGPVRLTRLAAHFRSPLCVGDAMRIALAPEGPGRVAIILWAGARKTTDIALEWELAMPGDDRALPPLPAPGPCRDPDEAALAAAEGAVPLALDPGRLAALLPGVAARLPHWQAAVLLASTRIVGMEAPGLHSVYSRLALEFGAAPSAPGALAYRAERYDPRFRFLRLAVAAEGVSGEIDAMVRPKPVPQPSMAELAELVPAGAFAGRRALVVGGSRGAGEVAAKLYAAGGAEVWITYASGAEDAARIAADIRAAGGRAETSALNVLDIPEGACMPLRGWEPTDFAYFATPRIEPTRNRRFSADMFLGLCRYYVGGFAEVFASVIQPELKHVFYPSTIYIDEEPAKFAEYVAAKAAGESLCASLGRMHPRLRIDAPHLPRMATDQTSAEDEGAAPVLARHLLAAAPAPFSAAGARG